MTTAQFTSGYVLILCIEVSGNISFLFNDISHEVYGFRPVISLKTDTVVIRGNGEKATPFVITVKDV